MKVSKKVKLLLSILISIVILIFIYNKIDLSAVKTELLQINKLYFAIYLLLFIPQVLLAGYRWKYILQTLNNYPVSFFKAFQMVVGSYSANLIVPAKMGEVVRIFWIDKSKSKHAPFSLVIFEKLLDILAVALIFYVALTLLQNSYEKFRSMWIYSTAIIFGGLIGFLFLKKLIVNLIKKKNSENLNYILDFFDLWKNESGTLSRISGYSVVLWLIQILQFYFMFRAFNLILPYDLVFAGSALSVLAGAIIISIGGVGPRDATIIFFFSGFAGTEVLASIGILSVFRIIIPAIVGLPFFVNLSRK